MSDDVSRETRRLNLVRDYAREGFESYRAHANETTHDGRSIPEWDQLGPEVQGHWSAAANRILWLAAANPDDVSRETSGEE